MDLGIQFPCKGEKEASLFFICNANLSWPLRTSGYCVPVPFNYLASGFRHFETSEVHFVRIREAVETLYKDEHTHTHK
jgi:hypothetical protein